MVNWAFIIGGAVLGAVVSLLAGLVGGVHFFMILLRMLIGSILFGVFGGIAAVLFDKFLPELLDLTGGSSSGASDNIDIIIGEDEGDTAADDEDLSESSSNVSLSEADNDEGSDIGQEAAAGITSGSVESASGLDEQEALLDPSMEMEPAPVSSSLAVESIDSAPVVSAEDGPEDIADTIEEIPGIKTGGGNAIHNGGFAGAAGGVEIGENLPDLESFSSTFTSAEEAVEEEDTISSSSSGDSGFSSFSGGRNIESSSVTEGNDPAQIAKAVQSMLRKDQEG